MQIFIFRNNTQEGPYNHEQVKELMLRGSDLVWHEGMADWLPAAQAPATANLFAQEETVMLNPDNGQQSFQQPFQQQYQQTFEPQPQYSQLAGTDAPDAPSNFHTLSLIAIIIGFFCCCNLLAIILGLVAYHKGSVVDQLYLQGDYAGAEMASRSARALSWAAFISAIAIFLVMAILQFLGYLIQL